MNKKMLCAALLAGLSMAQVASAQEFDDRWYVSAGVGYNLQDEDRRTNNAPAGYLGVGKFLSPRWSLEGQLNYQNPNFDGSVPNNLVFGSGDVTDMNWSQYGISVDARYHFTSPERSWAPYLLAGLGYQRSEETYNPYPAASDAPSKDKRGNVAAKLGFGVQSSFSERVAVRAEVAVRGDFDDKSMAANGGANWEGYPHQQKESYFIDTLASVGVLIPLGPAPAAPVVAPPPPPPPVTPDCSQMDSDGDGVNDCQDRCPGTAAGTVVGPDGCEVQVSIDLKGVNFDFDRATLRPDAVAILNEAVAVLQRYPTMRVEVAGHTDLCGAEGYNQALSERRARAVYEYLVNNGVAASRLAGPVGYGESRPLVQTAQNSPACRNEENRRTELNSLSN